MTTPDLQAVSDLCRLALVAQRLGCTVRLEGASEELRSLLELAGVDGVLVAERRENLTTPGENATDETDLR